MWIRTAWEWLVQEGIYRDMVAVTLGVVVTTAAAWRPFRKIKNVQIKTADLLDTKTPGGLTDVLDAIQQSNAASASGAASAAGDNSGN
jgi:hypothetical protein